MSCSGEALPASASVLAVCAHPDDESFGLGALLAAFAEGGARVSMLCFTHGEASTLGETLDLGAVRDEELRAAAAVLGVQPVWLLDYPDGGLAGVDLSELRAHMHTMAREVGADLLVTFDEGGITGHPDHARVTQAATAAGQAVGIAVLGWAIPAPVAAELNRQFATTFAGREPSELDGTITVDRARQRIAIACHASQATDNPVLWQRLELLGDHETYRWLIPRRGTSPDPRSGSRGARR